MFEDMLGADGAGGQADFMKKLMDDLKQKDSVVISMMNDERLMKVAEYEATHGYTKPKVTPELLQERFSEFKTRVLGGGLTLKALEDDVYSRWGVQETDRDPSDKPTKTPIGFNLHDLEVADLKEDSKANH